MPGVGHQVLKLKALLSSNKAATTTIARSHCAPGGLLGPLALLGLPGLPGLPGLVLAGGWESDFKIA